MPRISPGALAKLRGKQKPDDIEIDRGEVKPDSAAASQASAKIGKARGPGPFKQYVSEYMKAKKAKK